MTWMELMSATFFFQANVPVSQCNECTPIKVLLSGLDKFPRNVVCGKLCYTLVGYYFSMVVELAIVLIMVDLGLVRRLLTLNLQSKMHRSCLQKLPVYILCQFPMMATYAFTDYRRPLGRKVKAFLLCWQT
ncbi:hypothetical protein C8J57DRAFT_1250449 [Mycena rebaudengoi]|nr:hypothetical protein C8J57DRAFT_1250449 [Mycena rebaudengoi]